MTLTILLAALTCLLMIAAILFHPKTKIGRHSLSSYWLVTVAGALLFLLLHLATPKTIFAALTADTAVNPLKILVLFLSMTMLSVFLDELGFFRYLASLALRHAKGGQLQLFFILYLTVSILTVFTSNDVIILSFTPFICYFSRRAHINPIPYLAAEFVAANTFSMALVIGNPTNIYLATAAGIDFLAYLKVMLLPTLLSGIAAALALFLLFRRQLRQPMVAAPTHETVEDRLLLGIGLFHLGSCTLLLAVSSYIGLAMWAVAAGACASLFAVTLLVALVRRIRGTSAARTIHGLSVSLRRAPWELIPFILSMFVLIVALAEAGATTALADLFGNSTPILTYGVASFLGANLFNNIPMSVLFSSVIPSSLAITDAAVYATIIGSNLGAFMTPTGALAGIMWSSILDKHGYRFGYGSFLKLGAATALPALAVALLSLSLTL